MERNLGIKIGEIEELGQPVRSRLGQAAAVGVNQRGEKELYFVSNGYPATFYALDFADGHVKFSYDIEGSDTVWAMAIATDGNVYFSCTSDGYLYRYLPIEMRVEKVAGSADDRFIWDIQAAEDGSVVSATYPRSKVFEFNTKTSQFTDLGRMSEEEQYTRGVAVTAQYVYAGIGSTIRLVQLDRQTGAKQELHVEGYSGEKGFIERIWVSGSLLFLSVGSEMIVYEAATQQIITSFICAGGVIASEDQDEHYYFASNAKIWKLDLSTKQIEEKVLLPEFEHTTRIKRMEWIHCTLEEWTRLMGRIQPVRTQGTVPSNGSTETTRSILVMISCYADVWYYDPATREVYYEVLNVPPKPILIQTIAADKDRLYIGGYHRGLSFYDPTKQLVEAEFFSFPQIEGIGFLQDKVYFGTYTKANVYEFDKTRSVAVTEDDRRPESNPRLVFPIGHQQDRPFVLSTGDRQLFIGTIPDYGLTTGALTVYDEAQDKWTVYADISPNLSISGLAYKDGLLYVGTSIWGGLGGDPVRDVSEVIIWDTSKKEVVKRFVPDIPGLDMPPRMIGELSVGPDGHIWGAVDGTIFVMEPTSGAVIRSKQVNPSVYYGKFRPIYLRWGQDGLLYTTLARKLIVMDPETLHHEVIEEGPLSIMTLGVDGHIYYGKGSRLFRRTVTHTSTIC